MKPLTSTAALYARVSVVGTTREQVIGRQLRDLRARARGDGAAAASELTFVDDGLSSSPLARSALEQLRAAAAAGAFQRLYVHGPDRLARDLVHQGLLVDELHRAGVEVVFLGRAAS